MKNNIDDYVKTLTPEEQKKFKKEIEEARCRRKQIKENTSRSLNLLEKTTQNLKKYVSALYLKNAEDGEFYK